MPLQDPQKQVLAIIRKVVAGTATAEETRFAETYYRQFEDQPDILNNFSEAERHQLEAKLFNRINTRISEMENIVPVRSMHFLRRYRLAAAAVVILLAGAGGWFLLRKAPVQHDIAGQPQQIRFKNDVQPGTNGAILTLDNGRQIVLDSAHNGLLAKQGNTSVIKQKDQLSYQATDLTALAVSYNIITTPRGRQYPNLILADGSKVWLDAGSSIRFPTVFTGSERKVEITGQVWFDVVHNDKMPFKVIAKGIEIEDLGTQFNVNAYDDEEFIKTTLLEGKVKVSIKNEEVFLKPGEQAVSSSRSPLVTNRAPDLEQVMAWKNGVFQCENTDVASVMRQIARWYDVDIVYDRPVTKKLSLLNVPRSVTMTNILKIMEMTGNVKFVIEGKKVTVYSP